MRGSSASAGGGGSASSRHSRRPGFFATSRAARPRSASWRSCGSHRPDATEPGQQHGRGEHDTRTRARRASGRAGGTENCHGAKPTALSSACATVIVSGVCARRRAGQAPPLRCRSSATAASSVTGSRAGSARRGRPPRAAARRRSRASVAVTFGGHATVLARYHEPRDRVRPDARPLGRRGAPRRRARARARRLQRRRAHPDLAPPRRSPARPDAAQAAAQRRRWSCRPARAAWVSPLGFARVVELQPGADLELRGVQVDRVRDLARRRRARARPVVRRARRRARALYLCGDSGYFSGFADIGERFAPDIAVLPIGGFLPASFRARHMSPLDALYAFEDLRVAAAGADPPRRVRAVVRAARRAGALAARAGEAARGPRSRAA